MKMEAKVRWCPYQPVRNGGLGYDDDVWGVQQFVAEEWNRPCEYLQVTYLKINCCLGCRRHFRFWSLFRINIRSSLLYNWSADLTVYLDLTRASAGLHILCSPRGSVWVEGLVVI